MTFSDRCDNCGDYGECRWMRDLTGIDHVLCEVCRSDPQVIRYYLPVVDRAAEAEV